MKKSYRLILIVIALFILLAGCIPKIKDSSQFGLPSWETNMVLPLIKGQLPLGNNIDAFLMELGLLTDLDTSIYSYEFAALALPELKLTDGALGLELEEVWTQGAISVSSGLPAVNLDYDIDLGGPDQLLSNPQTVSFRLSEVTDFIRSDLFTRMRLSDNPANELNFSLTTDEPFEEMTISLINAETNQIIASHFINDGPGANDPNSIHTDYFNTFSIPLGKCQISNTIDLEITITVHSSVGHLSLNAAFSDQLEIVELEGFNVQNIDMELPTEVNIPSINPLEDSHGELLVEEIVFKSGKIILTPETETADNKPFPFIVEIDELKLGHNYLFIMESKVDLADVTFDEQSQISGKASFSFNEPFIYDVWDDTREEVKPYKYSIDLEMENIVAKSLRGDIGKIIEDANQKTPEWDFTIEEIDSSIQEITYPDELPEKGQMPEFNNLYLSLDFDNQTSFSGDFTVNMTTYEDSLGKTVAIDEDGQPLKASFQITIPERSNSSFELKAEDDYDRFIKILNSRPKYISFSMEGSFSTLGEDFYLDEADYIHPKISIEMPIELNIPAGGITIEKVYEQSEEPVVNIDLVNDFIKTAKLHFAYNNFSSLGFGCRLHFSTPEGLSKEIEAIVNPNDQDTITLAYDSQLAKILANKTGYNLVIDLVIPNPTDQPHTMAIKKSYQLDVTVWVEADINAHIPDEN